MTTPHPPLIKDSVLIKESVLFIRLPRERADSLISA